MKAQGLLQPPRGVDKWYVLSNEDGLTINFDREWVVGRSNWDQMLSLKEFLDSIDEALSEWAEKENS